MNSVLVDSDGGVRTITLHRPERLNALDAPCREDLLRRLQAAGDDSSVRAVVLTGAGRAFCTGQDVRAGAELEDAAATVRDSYNPLALAIRGMSKPVIAAINGPAVGAGLGLALSCDMRLMAADAYLACSFSRVGLVPDTGTSVALVRRLGHALAFELAASGQKISAEQALGWHLVNAVVPGHELADRARETASRLASGPATALALTKELLIAAAHEPEAAVLEREAAAQGVAAESQDHKAALAAFLAKSEKASGNAVREEGAA